LSVLQPGFITDRHIYNEVKDTIPNIVFKKFEKSGESYNESGTKSKNYILFNMLDFQDDILEENVEYRKQITDILDYYLENSAIIDFGNKVAFLSDKSYAYVDLSMNGDIGEALFNLYNIFHQLETMDIQNVLVFDYYQGKEGLYKTIYDRINRYTSGKKMVIPLSYLKYGSKEEQNN
jgi:hypothetical protein